ncbi:1205_t:CDS:2 [Acaulospora morrowiae]|uniref:1205_t:CDS:1 n=1 Tax=Acaulospora morrowiae TaxID=94023 RepID=A0A9N8Z6S8_9GLOM|nr:1205_t:CDS:2 [Acaulospora morrowiae]
MDVVLKCLFDSRNIFKELLNEARLYSRFGVCFMVWCLMCNPLFYDPYDISLTLEICNLRRPKIQSNISGLCQWCPNSELDKQIEEYEECKTSELRKQLGNGKR